MEKRKTKVSVADTVQVVDLVHVGTNKAASDDEFDAGNLATAPVQSANAAEHNEDAEYEGLSRHPGMTCVSCAAALSSQTASLCFDTRWNRLLVC